MNLLTVPELVRGVDSTTLLPMLRSVVWATSRLPEGLWLAVLLIGKQLPSRIRVRGRLFPEALLSGDETIDSNAQPDGDRSKASA